MIASKNCTVSKDSKAKGNLSFRSLHYGDPSQGPVHTLLDIWVTLPKARNFNN